MTTLFSTAMTANQTPALPRGRVALVALWLTQIALAGMFLFSGGLKLTGICSLNPPCSVSLCQSDKIRVVQIRTDHMAAECLLLGAFHIAVGVVVEDDNHGMDAILYGRGQFLHVV